MAKSAKAKTAKDATLEIIPITQASTIFLIIGTSPLVFNAVSSKSQRELLLPSGRKNAAARQQSLKHDPIAEYRNSVYRFLGNATPTRLCFPAAGFKKGMATAALDIPGATKSAVGRLSWVPGDKIAIYGVPKLYMTVVRSADMARTPDIRTRALLPEWACAVRVNYVTPQLNEHNVVHLLAAAGLICGIGDGRQEKGALSFGQYRICESEKDPDLVRIMSQGGRQAQDHALEHPEAYDADTLDLYSWASEEITRRRRDGVDASASKEVMPGEEDGIALEKLVDPSLAAAALNGTKRRPGRPRKQA